MSEMNLFDEMLFQSPKKMDVAINAKLISSKQQLKAKNDAKFSCKSQRSEESSHPTGNWCEVFSSSLTNVNAKQAWKNGAEKLSQTLNNVKTTFGALSQRIRKLTKKRQRLINKELPRSPVTPYTRSRAVLGRTPTKLYSPFSIDTPTGKENKSNRSVREESHLCNLSISNGEKNLWRTRLDFDEKSNIFKEVVLSNDLLQTQIGIYEFQSVASKIVQSCLNN